MGSSRLLVGSLFCFGLAACQLVPTKIYETTDISGSSFLEREAQLPLVVDENTVVLDARSVFDYSMAHVPQSHHLSWQDFTERGSAEPGQLKINLEKDIRRLARKGIAPDTRIVVVGKGKKGQGEEGRLAWTLLYLGIKNVQTASIDYFKKQLTTTESPQLKNQKNWLQPKKKSLLVTENELKSFVTKPTLGNGAFIIDVRSEKEYFEKDKNSEKYKYPGLNEVNIPWPHFITEMGRPNFKIQKQLIDLGVSRDRRIIVISNSGLRSAAVTAVLFSLGFKNVGNFNSGYQSLL